MKRRIIVLASIMVVLAACAAFAEVPAHQKHINMAVDVINQMARQDDSHTMGDTVLSGKAVAIFPNMLQTALGFGSLHGEGVVLVRNPRGGWYGPSFASIAGGSFGLQIGIQEVGLVLVITNQDGLQAFTGGNSFKLGGDVSVAAGPVGRSTGAATDSKAEASIYSYSMSKGLFAGIALSGSVINVNRDANLAYWGKKTEAEAALKRPATDKRIAQLTHALNLLMQKGK